MLLAWVGTEVSRALEMQRFYINDTHSQLLRSPTAQRAQPSSTPELACATFGGGSEGGDQGLQLQPQFFANGLSCHEGMKHNCFMRLSRGVVLAALNGVFSGVPGVDL